jgi:hypothetical protein
MPTTEAMFRPAFVHVLAVCAHAGPIDDPP